MITFLLVEQNVLHKPVLYLSHYFKRYRQTYYEQLQIVRDSGDWEGWLTFFLQGVIDVSREATATARTILTMREQHRTQITDNLGRAAGNGHRVLEKLYDRPIVSVHDVREMTGTTYPAANTLVARLEELGILSEITGRTRHRRFRFDPYVRLFDD